MGVIVVVFVVWVIKGDYQKRVTTLVVWVVWLVRMVRVMGVVT